METTTLFQISSLPTRILVEVLLELIKTNVLEVSGEKKVLLIES